MSKLRKQIDRIGRSDRPAMGFASTSREKPRAMLLAALADSAKSRDEAIAASCDAVIITATNPAAAVKIGTGSDTVHIARVDALDAAGTTALAEAGFDAVIAPLASTEAAAVNPDACGYIPLLTGDEEDTLLRTLAPIGCEAVAIAGRNSLDLAGQLGLVRIATFTSSPLLLLTEATPASADLRVFRDAGAAIVVATPGASKADLEQLGALLREVPPRRRRNEGADIPTVPMAAAHSHDHEPDEPFEDD